VTGKGKGKGMEGESIGGGDTAGPRDLLPSGAGSISCPTPYDSKEAGTSDGEHESVYQSWLRRGIRAHSVGSRYQDTGIAGFVERQRQVLRP